MNKIDLTKMKGEELFFHFTNEHADKDYASVVALLPYATTWDNKKAYSILERVVKENKTLIAVYPEIDDIDTSKMELVGGIIDGEMYISNEPYFKERM